MTINWRSAVLALAVSVAMVGCGEDEPGTDGGVDAGTDSGVVVDAGVDAGTEQDAGTEEDAGTDAGTEEDAGTDAGTEEDAGTDAGTEEDAGTDAGVVVEPDPAASVQIGAVKTATVGAQTPALPISGAAVTYVRPVLGTDPAGFFVQAEQAGPALFVAVNPTTLDPVPAVGDLVAFSVDTTAVVRGQVRATAISGFSVPDSGADVTTLVQNVSSITAAGLLPAFDSELITVEATIAGDFSDCSAPHRCAQITTAGVTAASADYRFRTTEAVEAALGLRAECVVRITAPLWRYDAQPQPSAWAVKDVEIVSCPAPVVQSAAATSPNAVVITFDAPLATATVTVGAFTIPGLTVSAAAVEGSIVTLETSAQVSRTSYVVTVAGSVTDLSGTPVSGTANTASFTGFETAATVVFNELNFNIADQCDLVELRALTAGSLAGYKLILRETDALTFPDGFRVAKDDLIIVHFSANQPACNGGTAAPANETVSKNEQNRAENFATAFDFWTNTAGVTAVNVSLLLRDPTGQIVEAVMATSTATGTAAAAAMRDAAAAGAVGQWSLPDGTQPTDGIYDTKAFFESAAGGATHGTTRAGTSIQRNTNADQNRRGDFTIAPSTWGTLNAGQTALP